MKADTTIRMMKVKTEVLVLKVVSLSALPNNKYKGEKPNMPFGHDAMR